jgi:hypothetical protein
LRPSGIFDSFLDLSRQFPPVLFAQGRDDRLFAVAGANGQRQKESKP